MVHFTGLLENARHPVAGPCRGTLLGDPCKNGLPARIGGWPGTATGGQIHVVHISHTHPPKEIIQALRKYLLGKKLLHVDPICNPVHINKAVRPDPRDSKAPKYVFMLGFVLRLLARELCFPFGRVLNLMSKS